MILDAKWPACNHLSEEALENYAFGRLPPSEISDFEEHLLLCEECCLHLDAQDDFAQAVRDFAKEQNLASRPLAPREGRTAQIRTISRFLEWKDRIGANWAVWALCAGLIAGIGIWTLALDRMPGETADVVALTTLRGSGDGMARARRNSPLDFSIDLSSAGALPQAGPYRLEVVNVSGRVAWAGTTQADQGKIRTRMPKRLEAGVYWVRLYSHSGKLLREFGLRLL